MMQGFPLSATLPEDSGLGERFWYWRGVSGRAYIHSIYLPGHCPPVAGAVFVLVRNSGGVRTAVSAGRFGADGLCPPGAVPPMPGDEIHVHLLTREDDAAEGVLRDLAAMLEEELTPPRTDPKLWGKPVQLELLAA